MIILSSWSQKYNKIIQIQLDNIRFFPRDVQLYDINPSEVLTSDKKNMTVDSYVLWEISDPLTFFQTVGTMGEAERRLDAATYTTLKNIMGTLKVFRRGRCRE